MKAMMAKVFALVCLVAFPAFGQDPAPDPRAIYGKAIYMGRVAAFERGRAALAEKAYQSEKLRPVVEDAQAKLDSARRVAGLAEKQAALLAVVVDERDVPFDLRWDAFRTLALQPAQDAAAIRRAVETGLARSRVIDAEKLLGAYLPALAAAGGDVETVIRDGAQRPELRWALWEHRVRKLAVEKKDDFAGFAAAAKALGAGIEFTAVSNAGAWKLDAGSDAALVPFLYLISATQRQAVFAFVEGLPIVDKEKFTLEVQWLLAHGRRAEALAHWNAREANAENESKPLRSFLFTRRWEFFGYESVDDAYLDRLRVVQTGDTGSVLYGQAYLANDDVLQILFAKPQDLVNALKAEREKANGHVTAEELQALVDRLIDGQGPTPLSVSQGAKDFAAKLQPGTYPYFMYRGEFDEAARFAWEKFRAARGGSEYSLWAKRTAEAVMCREQCCNGAGRDFLLWLNRELVDGEGKPVEANPIAAIIERQ